MGTPYLIPTAPANQQFTISLGAIVYTIKLRWNAFNNAWTLYISDNLGNPILSGVAVITGADLLAQFEYLGIGGAGAQMYAQGPTGDSVPDFSTMGSTSNLYFVTPRIFALNLSILGGPDVLG